MNRCIKTTVILVMFAIVVLPLSVVAQTAQQTCDSVLTAAQTAYTSGDVETALELASEAISLGESESNRSCTRRAKALKVNIERAVYINSADPGMVNLGDYSLFMTCVGEGSPIVVFENGFGQSHEQWRDIVPVVAQMTRVCTYDRIGHDPSDPYAPDSTFTTQDQVDALVGLLEVGEIAPPYILVGHCGTGMNLRLFVDQYPDQVAGLVMVDAFVPGLFFEYGANRLDEIRVFSMETERLDLDTSLQQVSTVGDLGDLPLVVLTAYLQTPILRDDWIALQAAYTTYSTNSRHIIAKHSGHFIMDFEPELIIDAIQWVMEQAESME